MLFSKKRFKIEQIELNREVLNKSMIQLFDTIHIFKEDECMKHIIILLKVAKDITLLDCASASSDQDRIKRQAKLEALTELSGFIDDSIRAKALEAKEGKKPVSGTVNIFRKIQNQAGAAF